MSAAIIFEQTSPSRIDRFCNGMLLSAQEFDRISDWEPHYHYELLNGVLIVVPPAGAGERSSNDVLGFLLRTNEWQHPQGRVLDDRLPEQTVRIGNDRRVADRTLWVGLGRVPNPLTDVPEIVIEIVSRSSRDRKRDYEVKRAEYLAAGVREYWIIDRYRKRFTRFSADGTNEVLGPSEDYQTQLLPGFHLPLSQVFVAALKYLDDHDVES